MEVDSCRMPLRFKCPQATSAKVPGDVADAQPQRRHDLLDTRDKARAAGHANRGRAANALGRLRAGRPYKQMGGPPRPPARHKLHNRVKNGLRSSLDEPLVRHVNPAHPCVSLAYRPNQYMRTPERTTDPLGLPHDDDETSSRG